jgi:hypothetical protein
MTDIPDEKEFNNIVFRYAESHEDKDTAVVCASAYRRDRNQYARVVPIGNLWVIYVANKV